MRTKGQFILFSVEEFDHWLSNTQFNRTIRRIQNHHTWKPHYGDFDGSNHFAKLEAMRDFHVNHNGWKDIAQNITTFPDGIVAICRSFETTPACIIGANNDAICIENLGDFDVGRDKMSEAHKSCIVRVNALLCREFRLTPNTETIIYHHWYDLGTGERNDGTHNNKSCPGTNFFGGNKVKDCEANFLPLVRAVLAGQKVSLAVRRIKAAGKIVPLRSAVVQSPDGILNVRIGPETSATKVGELANGTTVSIFEVSGGWCRIDPAQAQWVLGQFLTATPMAPTQRTVRAPTPAGNFVKTLAKVFNRGIPPLGFLQELVAWGKMAPDEIFVDQPGNEKDVYASVIAELGPFKDITRRKASMLEVMRVLAGFESSWKWDTGADANNPRENSPDTNSAGPFQVSANSLFFGQDLKDLVAPHGIRDAKRDGDAFQALMKTNHPLAMEYIARLMRHTRMANGPLKKGDERRTFNDPKFREEEQSIYPWLSREAVEEFEAFLRPRRPIRPGIKKTSRRMKRSGRSSGASAKRPSGSRKMKKAARA